MLTEHRLGDALATNLVCRAPPWFGDGIVLLAGGDGARFTITVLRRSRRRATRPRGPSDDGAAGQR